MTRNESFRRKIIYIATIAVLLVPLSVVSQPATVKKGGEASSGGLLAQLRKDHRLSQAELSDIDPASESMKLATLGLRPVAVTLLWRRIQEAKKKQQWDKMRTSTQTLIALQPNFIKVWEFQAHNLSYNISREFDDYQYRYHWVKEGLSYLMTGIAYNRKDHRIFDQLGFFFGLKLGRSDEKRQFRRLFRKDNDYHEKLTEHGIDTYEIDSPPLGGPDNWLTAYQWYDRSRTAVDNGMQRRTSGIMFYKGAPSQLRNYAVDFEQELRPDEAARLAWEEAYDEWVNEYGNREIRTSTNIPVFLDRLSESAKEMQKLREKLDKIIPGVRAQMLAARRAQITPEMWEAYNQPMDTIADVEQSRLHHMAKGILDADQDIEFNALVEQKLADGSIELTQEQKNQYDIIKLELQIKSRDHNFISKYRGTVNYSYWKDRCEAESQPVTIEARQALFDARQAVKDTKFDAQEVSREKRDKNGNVVIDPKTNQPVYEKVTIPGAIQYYEQSFNLWKKVFEDYPSLDDDVMEDDLVSAMQEYYNNLRKVKSDWPLDFPLQSLVDKRARQRMEDGLPTTDKELADRIERQKAIEALEKEAQKANDPMPNPNGDQSPKKGDSPNPAEKKSPGETPKKTEPEKSEPEKSEPAKTEPKKAEPKKTEPKKAEPAKTEPKKTEPKKTEPAKTEPKKEDAKSVEPKKDKQAEQKK